MPEEDKNKKPEEKPIENPKESNDDIKEDPNLIAYLRENADLQNTKGKVITEREEEKKK